MTIKHIQDLSVETIMHLAPTLFDQFMVSCPGEDIEDFKIALVTLHSEPHYAIYKNGALDRGYFFEID